MSEILAAWPAMIVGFAVGMAAGVVLLLAMRVMLKSTPAPPVRAPLRRNRPGVVRLGSAATDSIERARAEARPGTESGVAEESEAEPTWEDLTPPNG